MLRFGQREGPQLVHLGHVRQPARLLLLRAAHRDRQHGQARVHAEEHAEAAVAAVQFHRDQPARHRAHPGAPVALDVLADDAELGQPLDQRPADLGPFPVRADDRHDLLVDEPPDGDEVLPLLVGELLADGEEVRPEGFPEVRARRLRHCWLPSGVRSASRNASTIGGQAFGVRGQLEVAAVVDVQLAARYQPVHDPRVDHRDDRVVVAGQDQGGRPQPRQPRQAGPADAGDQLVVVAPGRAQACRGVQQVTGQRPGLRARCPRTARRRCGPRIPGPGGVAA